MLQGPLRQIFIDGLMEKWTKDKASRGMKWTEPYPGVGVPPSRVEAVLVPLVSVPWAGMTKDSVTLVLLVLWEFE